MPATYEPIATTTLGSNATSYTFSSIPSTYTDLVLVMMGQGATAFNFMLTLNSDSASNYSYTYLSGSGSAASSGRGANATPMYVGTFPSTQWGTCIVNLMNYSNTTTYKTVISRAGGTDVSAWVNTWRSTSAINSIKIENGGYNMLTGSTFTLYGIKAAA